MQGHSLHNALHYRGLDRQVLGYRPFSSPCPLSPPTQHTQLAQAQDEWCRGHGIRGHPACLSGALRDQSRVGEHVVHSNRITQRVAPLEKIREAVRAHVPELLTGSKHEYDLLKGKKLQDALDDLVLPKDRRAKLNAEQKEVQKITGAAKYFERGTCPRLTPMVHCLSCIMSFPPPGALQVARSVLAYAYTHIDDEIMYSDAITPAREIIDGKTKLDMTKRAPKQLEASADASNKVPHKIGILITRCGASVLHLTKLVGNAGTSTMEVESKATIKASELVEYAVTVERALGCPSEEPALLLTDSLSNQRVVTNSGSAAQARHLLAHMEGLKARQDAKILRVAHITDPENVSDFLTKGCDANKRERSVRYALGL
jgi:hypothetical protein